MLLKLDIRKNFLLVSKSTPMALFLGHLSTGVSDSSNKPCEQVPHRAEAGQAGLGEAPAHPLLKEGRRLPPAVLRSLQTVDVILT